MQFEFNQPWIPGLGTSFHLGVDGLSLPMVWLTALLTVLAVIASRSISDRVRQYFTLLLMLEAGLIGVFVALDLILFYLFWEVVLIPMYFLISIWGGPNRSYAAVKFFIYTLAGSLAMLGGIIAVYLATGAQTFDMLQVGLLSTQAGRRHADGDLHRDGGGARGEGAHRAAAHLAARRARRGARPRCRCSSPACCSRWVRTGSCASARGCCPTGSRRSCR